VAAGGRSAREIAAGAISIIPWDYQPIYLLPVLRDYVKRQVKPQSLTEHLTGILHKLLFDTDPEVRSEAMSTAREIQHPLPFGLTAAGSNDDDGRRDWDRLKQRLGWRELTLQTGQGNLLPFSGRFITATFDNMDSIEAKAGMVVCLRSPQMIESYFFGASGLIIPAGATMSHLCIRLREASMPFVMLAVSAMDRIPEGSHILVKDGVITVRIESD
jgi:hypothetical protein